MHPIFHAPAKAFFFSLGCSLAFKNAFLGLTYDLFIFVMHNVYFWNHYINLFFGLVLVCAKYHICFSPCCVNFSFHECREYWWELIMCIFLRLADHQRCLHLPPGSRILWVLSCWYFLANFLKFCLIKPVSSTESLFCKSCLWEMTCSKVKEASEKQIAREKPKAQASFFHFSETRQFQSKFVIFFLLESEVTVLFFPSFDLNCQAGLDDEPSS